MNSIEFWKNEWESVTNTSALFLPSIEEKNSNDETTCKTKRDKFPTAFIIESNYPKPYSKVPPNCQDNDAAGNYLYENQCAIRMSIALSNSGLSFKTYTDPKCSHGHARGARSLANWLWKNHLCQPKIYKGKDAQNIKTKINSKAGILYFHNLSGEINNDHIDIYFNNETQSNYVNLWEAKEYWFFELNDK